MMRKNYKKLVENYWLIASLISGTTFFVSLLFTTKVKSFPLDSNTLVISAAMSLSIGYQYALIKNILPRIRPTFKQLSPLFQGYQYQEFSQALEEKFRRSWSFYLTVIIVVIPFVILELIKVWNWNLHKEVPPYFYLGEPTLWSILLDIFNEALIYLIIFFLGVIIWIIIELTLITKELKEKYKVNADIFNVDETGGLKPLRFLTLSLVSNYFIVITLAIISYTPPIATVLFYIYPKVLITPEIIMLTIMLLIGIILFITTQKTIRSLINKSADLELQKINEKYEEIYDKIFKIIYNKTDNSIEKELGELRVALEILEKREIKIKVIKSKKFDIKTIVTFISTVLLPILTLIHQIKNLYS